MINNCLSLKDNFLHKSTVREKSHLNSLHNYTIQFNFERLYTINLQVDDSFIELVFSEALVTILRHSYILLVSTYLNINFVIGKCEEEKEEKGANFDKRNSIQSQDPVNGHYIMSDFLSFFLSFFLLSFFLSFFLSFKHF